VDDATALVLALIERLMEKKQNYGSVRACEPFLTREDVEAIVTRSKDKAREFRGERASGLVVPPGASP
jgi:hypothetical protein